MSKEEKPVAGKLINQAKVELEAALAERRGELELKVDAAIEALPENQRAALALCRQEELSYEEIAAVLGCSLSATKSLIHRARETLKARLKPYLHSGVWEEQK